MIHLYQLPSWIINEFINQYTKYIININVLTVIIKWYTISGQLHEIENIIAFRSIHSIPIDYLFPNELSKYYQLQPYYYYYHDYKNDAL